MKVSVFECLPYTFTGVVRVTICFFACFMFDTCAVEIKRLSIPRWVRNGTDESVILDCEYTYNENDIRLVVKWFFEDNLEPVYQWIPELKNRHISGVLKDRLDMAYEVNTADTYSRLRALRIPRPSTELSGKYTCLVTSLAGQDSREQTMTVFVPANEFELSYTESGYNSVNVSCEVQGAFPSPVLSLFLRPSSGSPPIAVGEVKLISVVRPTGAYDVVLHRTFKISELTNDGATVFECKLELPGTNYVQSKRIAYFPGLEGPRIEAPRGLYSSAHLSSVFPNYYETLCKVFIFLPLMQVILLKVT